MNSMTRRLSIIGFVMLVVLSAGCTTTPAEPTVTPSPIPPTPIPATPTPSCEVVCNIDTERYGINITCESGTIKQTMNDSTKFEGDIIKVTLKQSRTYENTGNTYQINGNITVDKAADTVSYLITVTGGAFGSVPPVCED